MISNTQHYSLFQKLLHKNMKILVIGAGIAGLAAAASLYQKGFTNVLLLEAQDYVGGRVLSVPLSEGFLELGAQWIHGTDNPLYDFSVTNDLLCDLSDEPSYEGNGLFCTSDGSVIQTTIIEEVKNILDDTKNKLCEGQFDKCSDSVKNIFAESFDSYISNCCNDTLNPIREGLFNWFLKFEIIDNACRDLNEVAVQCYSEWCDISDKVYHINFKKGFSSVVNSLYSQLPSESVHLRKPVKTIHWNKDLAYPQYTETFWENRLSNDYPVSVECESGENIQADAIVLTVPVGFIKENMHSLFQPTLPDKKAQAFSNIGFGTINKIYLIFETPFWGSQDHGFQLIWTTNLDKELTELLEKHPWIGGITGFDIVRKQPNVLLGWIGATEAELIESIDIDVVSNVCTNVLRKFLNRPDIPYPSKTVRTSWHSNKYIRGAYSYRSIDFYLSNSKLEDLRSPLNTSYKTEDGRVVQWPVVHFAGEAMDQTCFSSVHGAFQSGLEVADKISLLCSQLKDHIDG